MRRLALLAAVLAPLALPGGPARGGESEAEALFARAVRYERGEDGRVDLTKAHALFCRAARLGHSGAAFQVGWNYWTGLGVPVDAIRGFTWIAAAAEAGDGEARRAMALVPVKASATRPECGVVVHPARRGYGPAVPDIARYRHLTARGAIADAVRELAPRFALDPELVLAVIAVESNFDPAAVSPRKARGLMQLMPETARRFDVADPMDPAGNLIGGMRYLRWLLAYYRGDVRLALAGYNAGEGAVDRNRGIPPFAETRQYVRRIGALYPRDHHPFDPAAAEPSPLLAAASRF